MRAPLAALALGLALLSGCVTAPSQGVQSLAVSGGAVTVQGPEGYCIDTRLSRPARGFAAMASCAIISDTQTVPSIEGLITVQVGSTGTAGVTGAEQELAALLRSPAGLALLSGTGDASTVLLDTVETTPGVVIVHFTDSSAPIAQGVEQLEWRAFMDVGDRLITVGVRGFDRAPLERSAGLRLLNRALASLRASNTG